MKLQNILDEIKKGKTFYILNHLHGTKITQKDVEKFDKINHPVLKEKNGSLYLSKGKKYVCIDFCHMEIV